MQVVLKKSSIYFPITHESLRKNHNDREWQDRQSVGPEEGKAACNLSVWIAF